MEVRLAVTFLKVAELGNVTRAAEQLGYSQAAVTAHIQQLEREVGVPLFDRIGRGIQLTDAGRDFRSCAVKLIQASEDADAFAVDRSDPKGDLVIEASSSVTIGIISKLMPEFHELYPHIHVIVRMSEDTDIIISRVRQNRVDIGAFLDYRESMDDCITAAERNERFVFVAAASDQILTKKNVSIYEIYDGLFATTFMSTDKDPALRSVLDPFMMRNSYDLRPSVEFGANISAVSMLIHGDGRSFLPYFMVEDEIRRGTIAEIDTEEVKPDLYTQFIYSANRWVNPQMQAFIGFIGSRLKRKLI